MTAGLRKVILRFGGILLVVLGILHLAITPYITRLIFDNVTEAVAVWLSPPMLLNHIVVGILLIPLGIFTFFAAPSTIAGERWAIFITRVSTITVATLPVVLFLVMGIKYFGAIPFVVATVIVSIAALTLLAAAFLPPKSK